MKRLSILAAVLLLILSAVSTAAAAILPGEETGFGARALAMGGAYVAIADDGTAAYWNPAGITQINIVGITPSLSLAGDWQDLQLSAPADTWPPNLGTTNLQIEGMLGANFSGIGLSGYFLADANTSYTEAAEDLSSGSARGYGVIMVTLAHEFTDFLALGANLKYIYGQSMDFTAEGDPANPLTWGGNYSEGQGSGYAVDLGAMFKLGTLVRVGAMVKNVYGTVNWTYDNYTPNTTTGEMDLTSTTSDTDELTPTLQIGAAVKPPVIGTLIAVQVDRALAGGPLTYRVGLEQSLLVMKVRAGYIQTEGMDASYTAGVGLKLGPVVMDLAAMTDDSFALDSFTLTAGFTF